MRTEIIPCALQHLVPLVEKWGLGDDGYRDEQIENASIPELKKIVGSLSNETMEELNKWLEDGTEIETVSEEYLNYTAFLMAYEYADIVLQDKLRAKSC